MALETGTWISDLVVTNPPGGDNISEADDHLRLLKTVLKNHFPLLATAGGTGDVITLTLSPAWTEYKAGVMLAFLAANLSTGPVTLNVNALGAIAIQNAGGALRGAAIAANDLVVGFIRDIAGTKTFQMISFNRNPSLQAGALSLLVAPETAADIGFRGATINLQDNAYSLTLLDSAKCIYHTSASAHTWTIPANASVAFPVGTVILLENENGGGVVTLAITTDTLRFANLTGSRSIPANGSGVLKKMTSTLWRLTGVGIT